MKVLGIAAAIVTLGAFSGCAAASPEVTVTNRTNQTIRLSGNCIDEDAYTLAPGQSVNQFYLAAQCRIDNGDGLNGMLGCVTLRSRHTGITQVDLRNPPGPHQCWGSGSRY